MDFFFDLVTNLWDHVTESGYLERFCWLYVFPVLARRVGRLFNKPKLTRRRVMNRRRNRQ